MMPHRPPSTVRAYGTLRLLATGVVISIVALGCGSVGPTASNPPTGLVNPFTGTAARARDLVTTGLDVGNTFPGAVAPFGMLQWSPDTTPSKTNYGGGYSDEDTHIRGFSLTHFNGTGCPIMQDL